MEGERGGRCSRIVKPDEINKENKKLPTVLPQEDIWNIINATDNLKHRLILMTTYSAGLRSCEVRMLKPEHIENPGAHGPPAIVHHHDLFACQP